MKRWIGLTLLTLGIGGIVIAYLTMSGKADSPKYLFGRVDRGNVVMEVAATGTLQPVTLVQVGTQVSGTILELHADFNSQVRAGQLIAKLDPANFQAQVDQAEASVRSSDATLNDIAANIEVSKANLAKAQVDFINNEHKFKRAKELAADHLLSADEIDSAEYAYNASKAGVEASQAELKSVEAKLVTEKERNKQMRAMLEQARVNLEHCTILAPISGTVISRNVDVGQTVAASFSSPTLFTIAADLSKMYLYTNVDEADMARITEGKQASFTVDAYRGETFHGNIGQVRLSASTVQNVVTYNAIIEVDNRDLRLKPGMTANVKIRIEIRESVLRVPNAALRFQPDMDDAVRQKMVDQAQEKLRALVRDQRAPRADSASVAAQQTASAGQGMSGSGPRGGPGNASTARSRPVVWVLEPDKTIQPMALRTGATDGIFTEVLMSALAEGQSVITGMEIPAVAGATTVQRPPTQGAPGGMGGFMRGIR